MIYCVVPLLFLILCFFQSESGSILQELLDLEDVPKIAPFAEDILRDPNHVKDLNMQNTYAVDKPVAVKELIQNWRDQCVAVGSHFNTLFSSFKHLKPRKLIVNEWEVYLFSTIDQVYTIGYIATKLSSDSKKWDI
jgi:hypothetical protein